MSRSNELRAHWERVKDLLERHDPTLLTTVSKYRGWTTDDELAALLVSNELWGGAGSIADSAVMKEGKRTPERREIERAMVDLGTEQMRIGRTNVRTEMWVHAFREWQQRDI